MSVTIRSRLLVCVQAVDLDDPLMGFFVSWLEEAANQFETVTVLALRVGRYDLPKNVEVIPFREASSRSKLAVVWTLLKQSWIRRESYDAVFVRGDPHYVLIAGWLWRLLGKKVVFWYAHWKVSPSAVLASFVAHVTTASVKAAFSHPWVKPVFIGQNIDHRKFISLNAPHAGPLRCLVLGRVTPIKQIELVIQAFLAVETGAMGATLTIVGPRTDVAYEAMLRRLTDGHLSIIWGDAPTYDRIPELLTRYDVMLSACPASLDKVIVEGMMAGLPTIAVSKGIIGWIPEEYAWIHTDTLVGMSSALQRISIMSPEERFQMGASLRAAAVQNHSIQGQITKLVDLIK